MSLTLLQRIQIGDLHRKAWYEALAKIANDGLPLFNALEFMGSEFRKIKHPLTPIVVLVLSRLHGGGPARSAQQRRTLGTELVGLVPDDEAMLIQAGEASGRIAQGLTNAARLVDTKSTLRSTVVGALLKPVGYIFGLLGLLGFFSIHLMPSFEKSKPRTNWPSNAQLLGSIADHSVAITVVVLITLILAGAAVIWLVPTWTGKSRDFVDRHIFPFPLIAAINGASFLTTLAGYIGSGMPLVESVTNISSSANRYMQSQCDQMLNLIRRGQRPEVALCALIIVPLRHQWVIKVYAMTGDAAKTYETIAQEMVAGVQASVKRLFGYIINNLLLVCIGFMVIWIYGSLFEISMSSNSRS